MHGFDHPQAGRRSTGNGAPNGYRRPVSSSEPVTHVEVLRAAVGQIHGSDRPGQLAMADAVADACASGRHLLVQAGTGTGKSLGYLAPALVSLANGEHDRVIVATATLALQSQLATKDIPAALDAVEQVTGRRPVAAVLKGRSNYGCLHRIRDQLLDQDALFGGAEVAETLRSDTSVAPDSVLGAEVVSLREWAEAELTEGGVADRDDAPSHSDRAWQQVSVPVRECLGVQACPFGDQCFVEKSRELARRAEVIVTNHALLAIDAMHGGTALPEHDVVIVDEAHELVSRVTGAASAELSPQLIERVARRALTWLDDDLGLDFLESADTLRRALDAAPLERVTSAESPVSAACDLIRGVTRRAVSALADDSTGVGDTSRKQAGAAVKEVFDTAERMAKLADADVVYVADRDRYGRELRVAPLTVAGLMRDRILTEQTVVFTSATLRVGGDFTPVAGTFGLRTAERDDQPSPVADTPESTPQGGTSDRAKTTKQDRELTWRGLDVGSPFDYRRQGILYLAKHLPPPSRDGLTDEVLAEIAELLWAAGGRTLGLFASRRNAEAAAAYVRKELPKQTVLCQGDAQLSELTRRFVAEEETSLFGTLSLWQGIDVPGETCRLVIIDKIPFPRPDDPLMVARTRAVAESGGNGFMTVAAGHAALLLAQGSGRLIRRTTDRGMVAVLDPRLMTARYGTFLRATMPDMWMTTDRLVAAEALRRLASA